MPYCVHVKLPGGGYAIARVHGKRPAPCACGQPATLACDWITGKKKNGPRPRRCDAPLCAQHGLEVAKNKHLCPVHQRAWAEHQARSAAR